MICVEKLKISGVLPEIENPLPRFKAVNREHPVQHDESFKEEDRELFGYETGYRVLPYLMQDSYSRKRKELQMDTVILENENLKAQFLPSMGGRLLSLYDKILEKELLFKNPVFQPANLATRDAWFSGGIEWNIGIYGHSPLTCSPLFFARVIDNEGNEFLRAWEYERARKIYFSLDFHLPPGASELAVHVRIVNNNSKEVPMYWWTNIALPETKETRIFSESDEVLYIKPEFNEKENTANHFGRSTLQDMPSLPGKDGSYPGNFEFSSEYFFQTSRDCSSPWEAALQGDETLFYERSTDLLRYRKMFCWGMQRGGRHWCDYLSVPGEGDYVEIQGGMAPTQVHGMKMPAESSWTFTQYFSALDASGTDLKGSWTEARDKARDLISGRLDEERVLTGHQSFSVLEENKIEEILYFGSGWGALQQLKEEKEGLKKSSPAGMEFPLSSLREEQAIWVELLNSRSFSKLENYSFPLSYMVDPEWKDTLQNACSDDEVNPWPLIMLGVLLYEQDEKEGALKLWKQSLNHYPTALAYRNIAAAESEKCDFTAAEESYLNAYRIMDGKPGRPLCEEILKLYIKTEEYKKAWTFYSNLDTLLALEERLISLAAIAAYETAHFEFLEKIFHMDFASVREGETRMMDLWVGYSAQRLAHVRNTPVDSRLMDEAKRCCPPPQGIDFRMI
ncbi:MULTISPECIES: DUF5107 domain-containing protein [unclassified Oceanispirochaeta]|uniref:DUF5107 domain-containing protein n=1 Tax=unclassified Oceanispirochaeta TaxID=2635722 RepID=UPI000E09D160|nr:MULTISPECIES: DUF5107 domain-containing protein [unclassified Oceanispirochaeta]MBF9017731.1 DUF5107 domain-containing protein [Oceanispirochaeta sp. M2]NPD72134.1 DUF5107 domain-containing protein [Oceanispirochaeta sp. M1]RDG32576.1 DUF5107 domain-containing protein [Oceanispirochaeta sp. M1]